MSIQPLLPIYIAEKLSNMDEAKLVTGWGTRTARSAVTHYLLRGKYYSDLTSREKFEFNRKKLEILGTTDELWGSIAVYWLGYCSQLPELTDQLMFQSRWADSDNYGDGGAFCYHIPVKTKEDLPSVVLRLKQWCPNIKVKHTYSVTDIY